VTLKWVGHLLMAHIFNKIFKRNVVVEKSKAAKLLFFGAP